jgi:hypothetical protein
MRKTYVLDPETRELVEKKHYYQAQGAYIQGDIESIVSSIDGSVITSRSKLRSHNAKHGVVPYEEFGDAYFQRKAQERQRLLNGATPQQRRERTEALIHAFEKHR